jgi:hypothetical protein
VQEEEAAAPLPKEEREGLEEWAEEAEVEEALPPAIQLDWEELLFLRAEAEAPETYLWAEAEAAELLWAGRFISVQVRRPHLAVLSQSMAAQLQVEQEALPEVQEQTPGQQAEAWG